MISEYTKCDRCGKAWESYNSDKDKRKSRLHEYKYIVSKVVDDDEDGGKPEFGFSACGYATCRLDLCKECQDEFTKWLKGGEN